MKYLIFIEMVPIGREMRVYKEAVIVVFQQIKKPILLCFLIIIALIVVFFLAKGKFNLLFKKIFSGKGRK